MTHTLVIETQAETDYQLLLGLAHRLGLRVRESTDTQTDGAGRQSDLLAKESETMKRPLGTMKGSFRLSPDFDEPLDDLSDYM